MSKIEVCQKLFLVEGNLEVVGWVILFHNKYSGKRNRYCYWEKNANQQEKENAIVDLLKLKHGKRIKTMVNSIDQMIASGQFFQTLTYKVLTDSMSGISFHFHYHTNKLLILTNYDLPNDTLYYKSPVVPIKTMNEKIFKKLQRDYKALGRIFYHGFPAEYNGVVTEIVERWPKK